MTGTETDAGPSPAEVTSADPAVGLRAVRSLRALADRLEGQHVVHARALGWSWQDIAEALGVSRQAAHQKHGRTRKGS